MTYTIEFERTATDIASTPVILLGAGCSGIELVSRLLGDHFEIDFSTLDGLIPPSQPERWGFAVPGCTEELHLLAELYPDARFLHVVRDGRDVVLSQPGVASGRFDTFAAAADWANTVERIGSFLESIPPRRGLEIRYEDLLLRPVEMLDRIIAFLGIDDFDGSFLASIRHGFQRDLTREQLAVPCAAFRRGELKLFERIAGMALYRYGYATKKPERGIRSWAISRAFWKCDKSLQALTSRRWK
ncbi:MAG: sulfotransferase [Planctomycetaceae bacterium]